MYETASRPNIYMFITCLYNTERDRYRRVRYTGGICSLTVSRNSLYTDEEGLAAIKRILILYCNYRICGWLLADWRFTRSSRPAERGAARVENIAVAKITMTATPTGVHAHK